MVRYPKDVSSEVKVVQVTTVLAKLTVPKALHIVEKRLQRHGVTEVGRLSAVHPGFYGSSCVFFRTFFGKQLNFKVIGVQSSQKQ